MTCKDDGKGFKINSKLKDASSYGIQSLYHRTKLLDGSISITSDLSNGTTVCIEIPSTKQENHEKN